MIRNFALLVFIFTSLVHGQTERDSLSTKFSAMSDTIRTYELPEIVVTASRMARRQDDIGRSVTVLSKEQIQSMVSFNVGELLTRTEGSYVVGAGQNPGIIQSLFMRGASSNQTGFFVDDVRIADPSSVNSALDLSELSLAGIQQVEIVRGSHSMLYGSSAIGGVVNMITERPNSPGINIGAGLTGGTFGEKTHSLTQSLSLNYSMPVGLYVLGEINNATFKGLDATRDTLTNPLAFRNRDRDGFKKSDLFGKVGFTTPALNLYLSARVANQRADIDDGAYVDDDNSTLQFDRKLLTYGASYRVSDLIEMKYVGGHSTMNRIAIDDSSLIDWTGKTDQTYTEGRWKGSTLTNEVQAIVGLEGARAIVGVGRYSEAMSSRFFSRSSFGEYQYNLDTLRLKATTQSLFSHLVLEGNMAHSSLSRFALALGARLSKHSTFGNHVTFEINPSFRMSDRGLLFGSISSGFNAPSLYQLFTPERHYLSGITRGNSTLKPERSLSYEIGLRQEILEGLTVSVSAFQTTVRNAIEYVYLWDKSIGIDTLGNDWMRDDSRGDTYLNLGTQKVRGIELTVRSKLLDRLEVTANLSLLRGTLHYSPQQIAGIQATGGHHVQLYNSGEFLEREVRSVELVRRPSTANVAVSYMVNDYLSFRADVRYAGSRKDVFYDSQRGPYGALGTTPVEAYTIVDLTQRLHVTNRFIALVRVENIFNTKYAEIRGFSTRGRGIQMSLRYTLGDNN